MRRQRLFLHRSHSMPGLGGDDPASMGPQWRRLIVARQATSGSWARNSYRTLLPSGQARLRGHECLAADEVPLERCTKLEAVLDSHQDPRRHGESEGWVVLYNRARRWRHDALADVKAFGRMMAMLSLLCLLAAGAAAQPGTKWAPRGGWWHLPGDEEHVSGVQNATFSQLIDHDNPSLGTFEQFYYWDTSYWKGPGSPVVLFTPGEINVTGYTNYLTTNRTTGVVAQQIGAATIVIEHRYWGTSSPTTDLTTANMTYLTLDQAIRDLTYFANNVRLPFAGNAPSNAADVPWVLMGGSYSGALSAWTESVAPGTMWAYLASSAPVEAVSNYWGYFRPVQEGMPKNCSADVARVIDYMDGVMVHGSAEEVHALKEKFGLQNVTHNDDFMAALENGPWLWQGNQVSERMRRECCTRPDGAAEAMGGSWRLDRWPEQGPANARRSFTLDTAPSSNGATRSR